MFGVLKSSPARKHALCERGRTLCTKLEVSGTAWKASKQLLTPCQVPAAGLRGALSDRYTLGEVLGRGAFGQVLKGHDNKTGKPVAIKQLCVPHPYMSTACSIRRFARHSEAEVLRSSTALSLTKHKRIRSIFSRLSSSGSDALSCGAQYMSSTQLVKRSRSQQSFPLYSANAPQVFGRHPRGGVDGHHG